MAPTGYDENVFINCPFDREYAPIFEAIVFTVHDAGFRPSCARERLDSIEVRLQKFISDIGGLDIQRHDNDPRIAVARVRDWLRTESGSALIPGGTTIYNRYIRFRSDLRSICSELRLDLNELTFVDFSHTILYWL